jgi:hypothetical protein
MTTMIATVTGSLYELDGENHRIRRVSGERAPTIRQGTDGTWRSYVLIAPEQPTVGSRLVVVWEIDVDGHRAESTILSEVRSVTP